MPTRKSKSPADGKAEVKAFLARRAPADRKLFETVLRIVRKAAPKAQERLRWGWPGFTGNKDILFIYPAGDHINVGFHRGVDLTDPKSLLEGTGKGMRHVKVHSPRDIDAPALATLVKQAVRIDQTLKPTGTKTARAPKR